MKQLQIAKDLALPIDAVTQKIAVLGMTGSGKSYCMTKLAEMFLDARAQVVILDPKGEAWGLRLMADGKTPAYQIPVFGGDHGDIPLTPDMGARIAELLVDGDYSAVLDVSEFISSELARFGYDFATRLFQLKKRKPGAMSLMIDEVQDFIPQNPQPGSKGEENYEPKMLHAFERVGKQLRSKGVGMVLAGQRPQEINKKVLNMCECWFAFQMTGLQERETMIKIFQEKDREEAQKLTDIIPRLEIGHAHVWSPRWLKVSETFLIAEKKTFDTSATPEVGARRVEPRKLSPIDIESLNETMQEVIAEAEENDPKNLKKRVAQLEKELRRAQSAKPAPVEPKVERVEVPVLTVEQIARLESVLARADEMLDKLGDMSDDINAAAKEVRDALRGAQAKPAAVALPSVRRDVPARPVRTVTPPARAATAPPENDEVTRPMQRILDTLHSFRVLGLEPVSKSNVAVFSDQSPTSSGYTNNLGRLRTLGLIDYPVPGQVALTVDGLAQAGDGSPIASLEELHRAWLSKLSNPRVRILENLIRIYPEPMRKDALADLAGQSKTSSGYTNNLGALRSLGLIDYPQPNYVVATGMLFPDGLD